MKEVSKQIRIQSIQCQRLLHEIEVHEEKSVSVISLLQNVLNQEKQRGERAMSILKLYLGEAEEVVTALKSEEDCEIFLEKLQQSINCVEKKKVG